MNKKVMSIIIALVHFLRSSLQRFSLDIFLQLHVPYQGLFLRLVRRIKCLYAAHIIGAISCARKN